LIQPSNGEFVQLNLTFISGNHLLPVVASTVSQLACTACFIGDRHAGAEGAAYETRLLILCAAAVPSICLVSCVQQQQQQQQQQEQQQRTLTTLCHGFPACSVQWCVLIALIPS
jgi:hypothetical protein